MVCAGLNNAVIAQRLGTTEQVIKNHLRHVFAKAAIHTRAEFIVFAFRDGFVVCPCQRRSPVQSSVENLGQQSENLSP
jgi:Bacterial regulatory proteins, luxR family